MNKWNVYYKGRRIEEVYFDIDYDKHYVKNFLVNHDNYPSGIAVVRSEKNENNK